jgi:glucose/arabinose dehydrogenase
MKIAACIALAALCACGTSDTDCSPTTDELSANAPAAASDVQPILAQNCAVGGCHLSQPGAGGLVLDVSTATWPNGLVGVAAHESPSMDLVTAGDPDRSWLVHKIFGSFCGAVCNSTLGCGAEMPFGASLSDADRGTIVAWVLAGAPSS